MLYLRRARRAARVHDDGRVVGRGRDGGYAVAHCLARVHHAAEGQDLDVRQEALRLGRLQLVLHENKVSVMSPYVSNKEKQVGNGHIDLRRQGLGNLEILPENISEVLNSVFPKFSKENKFTIHLHHLRLTFYDPLTCVTLPLLKINVKYLKK